MTRPRGFAPPAVFASDRPLVFAHRGGSKIGPENTWLALTRGLAAGADGIECDVRLAADGEPVLMHDATLERTTDGRGPVHALTSTALAAIDATCRFVPVADPWRVAAAEGVPTLRAVLGRLGPTRLIIELKDDDPRLADAVVTLVREYGAVARTCLGSFHQRMVERVRTIAPGITTSASRPEAQRTLARSWIGWPFAMSPPYRAFQVPEYAGRLHVVTPAFVRRAHREQSVVQVWTVDQPADVQRLLGLGVDGIISDRPDLAVPARDVWCADR